MKRQPTGTRSTAGVLKKTLFWLLFASSVLLIFLLLFNTFESISLRAVQKSYTEFTQHTATISESIQSLVRAMGTQIYYISSTTRLRTAPQLATFDRIYAMRELGQYVSSSSMMQSIYVFNDAQQMAYSTDELFFSTGQDTFGDTAAVAMHRARSRPQRMQLQYRLIQAPGLLPSPRGSYALMVFEVDTGGVPLPGSILLNLDPAWFQERLLSFPGDSYIVLDEDQRVIARQAPWLDDAAAHFLPLVRAQEGRDGYVQGSYNGQTYLCFFSVGTDNGWLHLRIMRLADQLPGLWKLRSTAFLVFGGAAAALLLALVFSFFRIYSPFSKMRTKLQQSDPHADVPDARIKPVERLDSLLAASQTQATEAAFRAALAGKPSAADRMPMLPAMLLLAETPSADAVKGALGEPDALLTATTLQGDVAVLLRPDDGQEAMETVHQIAVACGCRCYVSVPVEAYGQLPARLGTLRELQRLRWLYPGQRVFHETLLAQHRDAEAYPSEESAAMLSALRAGDMQAVRAAFFAFVNRLRRMSYPFVRYALEHLLELVEGLADEGAAAEDAPPVEELMSRSLDPEELLGHLWPMLGAAAQALEEKRRVRVSATAQQAVERLNMGYRDPSLSAQQIAEEMGISSSYLRRQFFEAHQMSISEYLNQVRIRRVQELLRTTDLTVEAIAGEVGFDNTKYLFVLFKRIVGCTPRQYRLGGPDNEAEAEAAST